VANICPGNRLLNGVHSRLLSISRSRFDREVTTRTCSTPTELNFNEIGLYVTELLQLTIFQMGVTCHLNFEHLVASQLTFSAHVPNLVHFITWRLLWSGGCFADAYCASLANLAKLGNAWWSYCSLTNFPYGHCPQYLIVISACSTIHKGNLMVQRFFQNLTLMHLVLLELLQLKSILLSIWLQKPVLACFPGRHVFSGLSGRNCSRSGPDIDQSSALVNIV